MVFGDELKLGASPKPLFFNPVQKVEVFSPSTKGDFISPLMTFTKSLGSLGDTGIIQNMMDATNVTYYEIHNNSIGGATYTASIVFAIPSEIEKSDPDKFSTFNYAYSLGTDGGVGRFAQLDVSVSSDGVNYTQISSDSYTSTEDFFEYSFSDKKFRYLKFDVSMRGNAGSVATFVKFYMLNLYR